MAIILPPGSSLDEEPEKKTPEAQSDSLGEGNLQENAQEEQPNVEPTKQEEAKAAKVAKFLLKELKTPGSQVALFCIPEIMQLVSMWMEGSIGAIIVQVCLADRKKILAKLDASIKEQMRVQQMVSDAKRLDPKIAKQMNATLKLDPPTYKAIMTAFINIMGTMPPPAIKLNLMEGGENQGQGNVNLVQEKSGS